MPRRERASNPFRIVVCERAPRWAILLRAMIPQWPLSEARSLKLADEAIAQSADGHRLLVVVAISDTDAVPTMNRLAQWTWREPSPVIVIAHDAMTDQEEWLWREAGAAEVLSSATDVGKVSRILARLCPHGPPAAIDALREESLRRLPFADQLD
jgi:hypothetical protein